MGTWGAGAFENDHANDWLGALVSEGDFASVEEAIERALTSKAGRSINLDDAIEAVAAAEIVASARGQKTAEVSSELAQWVADNDYRPTDMLAARAAQAVERIAK